jgi:ABC-2 type transport system permease protein
MSGGRVLWALDGVRLSRDELGRNAQTPCVKNETNLDDLLFTYGVRINPVLLQDLQCTPIILTNDAGQYSECPWYYSILLLPSNNHPVTKDIPLVKAEFASTIDFVNNADKTVRNILLTTSLHTHILAVPGLVSFDFMDIQTDADYFNKSFLPAAVSLQGVFNSAYINRHIPDSIIIKNRKFLPNSQPTKMLVVSASDVIRNGIFGSGSQAQALPAGYDRVSGIQYGNRSFIVNAVNWLVNDDDCLFLRTKQRKMRLIDKQSVYLGRDAHAVQNILVPLVFVLLVVGCFNLYRKRKYGHE